MLGLLGGAIGTGVAYGAVRLLKAIGPDTLPRLQEIAIDARVLAFALLVSILSGILFGLIPAFKYAGRRLSGMLVGARGASESRERLRMRNGLVVAQVALALVLLVGSGLMIRTFLALRGVEPGFDTSQLQTIGIAIPTSVAATSDQVAQIHKALLEELADHSERHGGRTGERDADGKYCAGWLRVGPDAAGVRAGHRQTWHGTVRSACSSTSRPATSGCRGRG